MKILSKKRKFIILSSLLVIILIVTVVVVASMRNKVLGDAEIIVYAKGKRIVLDTESPYFRELQAACEELLIYSFRKYLLCKKIENLLSFEKIKDIKNKEYAIELTYKELVSQEKWGFAKELTRFIPISQIIIPLSGNLTHFKMDPEKKPFMILFPLTPISTPDGKVKTEIWGLKECILVGSRNTPQKIKNILTHKFNISIPD